MANRTTGVNLVVTGEKEFRDAITSINAAYKIMNAQLKEASSAMAANAGDMDKAGEYAKKLTDALDLLKSKQKTISEALANAEKHLEEYTAQMNAAKEAAEKNAAAMEAARTAYGENSEKFQKLAEEQKKLNEEFENAQGRVNAAQGAVNRWKTELANTNTVINKTTAELNKVQGEIDGVAESSDKAAEAAEEMGEKTAASVNAVASAMASAQFERVFDELVDGLTESAEAAIKWESAFAGVKKTVNAEDWELDEIASDLRDMALEIPVAADELARIAEIAGQLGIQTNGITNFTETIAQLTATTNLNAEEAANSFARFANIVKMSEADYGRMGSAVVALGNSFATTESEIMDMSMRLAAAGAAAGLAEPEILGIAAALSSVGLESQQGGSAMSKAIKQIQTAVETGAPILADYAEVAGMTTEAFANLWNTDTASAITQFIAGIGNVDENAQSIIMTLDDLGMTEIRLSDTMARLAGNSDLLDNAIAMSNQAWEENIALTNEAAVRYETTESKIQLLKNAADELKIAFGEQLTPALNVGAEGLTGLTEKVAEFIKESDGAAAVATGLATAFGALAGTAAIGTAINSVIPALTAFLTLGGGIPALVIGIVSALAGITAAVAVYASSTEDLNDVLDEHRDKLKELKDQAAESKEGYQTATEAAKLNTEAVKEQAAELQRLIEKERQTAADKEKIKVIVSDLNEKIPGLSLSYDELSNSLNMNAESIEAWIEKAYLMEQMQAEFANMQAAEDNLAAARKNLTALREEYDASIARMEEYQKKAEEANQKYTEAIKARNQGSASAWMREESKYLDLIKEEERLQNGLLKTYKQTAEVRNAAAKEAEAAAKKYNELAEMLKKTEQAEESAAKSAQVVAEAMGLAAMSADELKEELEGVEEAYEDTAEGIELLGDALMEAIEEKHKQAMDEALDALDNQIDAVEKKLDEETDAYEQAYQEREGFVTALTDAAIGGLQEQIDLLEEMTGTGQALLDALDKEVSTQSKIGKISGYESEVDNEGWARFLITGYGGAYEETVEEYERLTNEALDAFGEKISKLDDGYRAIYEQYKIDVAYIAERYAGEIAATGDEAKRLAEEVARLEKEAEASERDYAAKQAAYEAAVKSEMSTEEYNALKKAASEAKDAYKETTKEMKDIRKEQQKEEADAGERRVAREEELSNRMRALKIQMYVDLLNAAEQYNAEELRMMAERDALAEKYNALRKEAEGEENSDIRIAELNDEQERAEAEYSRKIAESQRDRYEDLYQMLIDYNAEELNLTEEQYDALVGLAENANSMEADAARDLRDQKKKALADTLELVQDHADSIVKVQSDALEREKKDVENAQEGLIGVYRSYYDQLVAEAENEAERTVAALEAQKKTQKENYEKMLTDRALYDETIKTMTKTSGEEQIEILDSFTPEWRTAGQSWADALSGGVSENVGKILAVIETTVAEAQKQLGELEGYADAVNQQLSETENAAELAELRRMYNQYGEKKDDLKAKRKEKHAAGENVDAITEEINRLVSEREKIRQRAIELGTDIAYGLAEGIEEGAESVKDAAEKVTDAGFDAIQESADIHSPSRRAKKLGGFWTEGLALGMEDRIELIRRAGERLTEEMEGSVKQNTANVEARAVVQQKMAATVQTPDLIRALQGLQIKSIGYHQTNNFNGQTSPYQAARAVELAIRRALT